MFSSKIIEQKTPTRDIKLEDDLLALFAKDQEQLDPLSSGNIQEFPISQISSPLLTSSQANTHTSKSTKQTTKSNPSYPTPIIFPLKDDHTKVLEKQQQDLKVPDSKTKSTKSPTSFLESDTKGGGDIVVFHTRSSKPSKSRINTNMRNKNSFIFEDENEDDIIEPYINSSRNVDTKNVGNHTKNNNIITDNNRLDRYTNHNIKNDRSNKTMTHRSFNSVLDSEDDFIIFDEPSFSKTSKKNKSKVIPKKVSEDTIVSTMNKSQHQQHQENDDVEIEQPSSVNPQLESQHTTTTSINSLPTHSTSVQTDTLVHHQIECKVCSRHRKFPGLHLVNLTEKDTVTGEKTEVDRLLKHFKSLESVFQSSIASLKSFKRVPHKNSKASKLQSQGLIPPTTICDKTLHQMQQQILIHQSNMLVAKFQYDTVSNAKITCPSCALLHQYCVCNSIPEAKSLRHALSHIGTVFIYTHFKELNHQRSSNTGKWAVHAGAHLVTLGQEEQEEAMARHILSKPKGSVVVLYPSRDALTVQEFLHRLTQRNKINAQYKGEPVLTYTADDLDYVRGRNQAQAEDNVRVEDEYIIDKSLLNDEGILPLDLTVIVLDATWGLARSLNRRLERVCARQEAIEAGITFDEELYDLRNPDKDQDQDIRQDHVEDQKSTTMTMTTKTCETSGTTSENTDNYPLLTRVYLTQALRTDVGALRRVFGNVSSILPGTSILPTQSSLNTPDLSKIKPMKTEPAILESTTPNIQQVKSIISHNTPTNLGNSVSSISPITTMTTTTTTTTKTARVGRIDVAGLPRDYHPTFNTDLNFTTKAQNNLQDVVDFPLPEDETGAKKVSTLHAFCVLLEELFGLSREGNQRNTKLSLQSKVTDNTVDNIDSMTRSHHVQSHTIPNLDKSIQLTKTQKNASNLILALFNVLETSADAYHIQLNCRKSELISVDLRERLDKKRIELESKTPLSKRQMRKLYNQGLIE